MLLEGVGPHSAPCTTDESGIAGDPFFQILLGKVGGKSTMASPRTLMIVEQATSLCCGGRTTDPWPGALWRSLWGGITFFARGSIELLFIFNAWFLFPCRNAWCLQAPLALRAVKILIF